MFSDNKALHLGKIYHLIEQFELISRTDLAKLSGLAPASVTNLTKILIDNHFILERTVQTTLSRGRPSVGLAVSNFFWQLLCVTVSSHKIEISLCKLNGAEIYKQD
ncbi:TPA: ROK family protein, partial [Mannheimia haemolytica]|nr:ROK family protein [Mannheimia haemolytica]